ncbi:MAG: MerR family DNA-binding transcriptional regulator [Dermatophilaceae bacterium]
MSNEPDLTIGEAARRIGVSVDTLRRWEREERITSTRTPGNQRRYPAALVEQIREGRAA